MGIPNIIFLRYNDPLPIPFDPWAISFRPMKKIQWSITGAGGVNSKEQTDETLRIAKNYPNFSGFHMDDFFHDNGQGSMSVEDIKNLRVEIANVRKDLNLWVVVYTHQLDEPMNEHIKLCDGVSLWTWKPEDLVNLEENLAKLKKVIGDKKVMIGCYMWDYGAAKPMPVDRMKYQCELGYKLLKEGQIEGMIFIATNICDLELEAVEWTREWIKRVGDADLINSS